MDESATDKLNRVVAEFEAQFTVHDNQHLRDGIKPGRDDWSKCATGAEYRTVVGKGQNDRLQAWIKDATAYAQEANGAHLWWRTRPQIEDEGRPQIYSRFVITKGAEPEA